MLVITSNLQNSLRRKVIPLIKKRFQLLKNVCFTHWLKSWFFSFWKCLEVSSQRYYCRVQLVKFFNYYKFQSHTKRSTSAYSTNCTTKRWITNFAVTTSQFRVKAVHVVLSFTIHTFHIITIALSSWCTKIHMIIIDKINSKFVVPKRKQKIGGCIQI